MKQIRNQRNQRLSKRRATPHFKRKTQECCSVGSLCADGWVEPRSRSAQPSQLFCTVSKVMAKFIWKGKDPVHRKNESLYSVFPLTKLKVLLLPLGWWEVFPYQASLQCQLDVLQFHSVFILSEQQTQDKTQMLRLSLVGLPLLEMSVLWGDCTDDHQLAIREVCTTPSSGAVICQNGSCTQKHIWWLIMKDISKDADG